MSLSEHEKLLLLLGGEISPDNEVETIWLGETIVFDKLILHRLKKRLASFFLEWRDEFFPNDYGYGGASVWKGYRLRDNTLWTRHSHMLTLACAVGVLLELGKLGLADRLGEEIEHTLNGKFLPLFCLIKREDLEKMTKEGPQCFGLLHSNKAKECKTCEDVSSCKQKFDEKIGVPAEVKAPFKEAPTSPPQKEKVTSFGNPEDGDSKEMESTEKKEEVVEEPTTQAPEETQPETEKLNSIPKEETQPEVSDAPDLPGDRYLKRSEQRRYALELLKQGPHSRSELCEKVATKFNTKGRCVNMLIIELKKRQLIRKEGKQYRWIGIG